MNVSTAIQCVIVHHRSPLTVANVVKGALDSGILADRIVVVDNSPSTESPLELPSGVLSVRVENLGYAAAANHGVRVLTELADPRPLTLVASHEAEIAPDALDTLSDAMTADASIAAAGPTLLLHGTNTIWSTGGLLSPILHRADHHRQISDDSLEPQDREWLDGALVLYRTELLVEHPFDESYFLYFEETDLHVRLSRAGYRVVWVPAAIGHQSSSGIPPRLLGRNTLLFQMRHFNIWTGRAAVIYAAVRMCVRKLITGRGSWSDPQQIIAGWLAAEHEIKEHRVDGRR